MPDFGRRSPSTHSTYPVAEIRRERPDAFRTLSTENLLGASKATYTHSSDRMPTSVCSNTLYPNPCRVVYGEVPRLGSGVGDQTWPLSSSRRYTASPLASLTGSLCQGVRRNSCAFSLQE